MVAGAQRYHRAHHRYISAPPNQHARNSGNLCCDSRVTGTSAPSLAITAGVRWPRPRPPEPPLVTSRCTGEQLLLAHDAPESHPLAPSTPRLRRVATVSPLIVVSEPICGILGEKPANLMRRTRASPPQYDTPVESQASDHGWPAGNARATPARAHEVLRKAPTARGLKPESRMAVGLEDVPLSDRCARARRICADEATTSASEAWPCRTRSDGDTLAAAAFPFQPACSGRGAHGSVRGVEPKHCPPVASAGGRH